MTPDPITPDPITPSLTPEQLNADYGITDQLQFVSGPGEFPIIAIANRFAQARISLYGGQVLSFQPASEPVDLMFVSDKAYYATGKAIKGGTPICWPWFGPDPDGQGRPSHGFVRNRPWNVWTTETTETGETRVILSLTDTEETRGIWPYRFELAIAITVGQTLTLELITRNTDDQPFKLTQALHSYFTVGDIRQVKILGLDNKRYLDKVDGGAEKTQTGPVAIEQEVDRIYLDVPSELAIEDPYLGRRIKISAHGSKTAVVWNPGAEIAAQMADLGDDDYRQFVCVETANAATEVIDLAAGETYRLHATYEIDRT